MKTQKAPDLGRTLGDLARRLRVLERNRLSPVTTVTRSSQTVSAASETTLIWSAAPRNPLGLWTSGTQLVIPTGWDGLWQFSVAMAGLYPTSSGGFVSFHVNGAAGVRHPGFASGVSAGGSAVESLELSAGDYVEATAYSVPGSTPTALKMSAVLLAR